MSLRTVPSLYTEAQVRKYLSTIALPGFDNEAASPLPEPTLANLSLIMAHHLFTFPFENTSIHYEPARTVDIDPQAVFTRSVLGRKGGYCMSMNLLFLNVLRGLGYRAFCASGRVAEGPSPPRWTGMSHMVVFVLLPDHTLATSQHTRKAFYLVDVGFGARGLMRPMLLREGHSERGRADSRQRLTRAPMPSSSFDLDKTHGSDDLPADILESQNVWRFQAQDDSQSEWNDNYSFTTTESFTADYRVSNTFTSSSPDTIFTQTLMIVSNSLVDLPGGAGEARQLCERDGLHPDLYPYHPSQLAQDVLFKDRLTRRPGGADYQKDAEVVQVADERQRIAILKDVFRLLPDITSDEAAKAMKGSRAELVAAAP